MYVDKKKIIDIFESLNDKKIQYVLLRNINDELPNQFQANKDIDLLIKPDNKDLFRETIKNNGWNKIKHPWDFGSNFVFLYGMDEFEMYRKDNINLDICYQLSCRSTNNGEWMPIDQIINNSVWENKTRNIRYPWFEMAVEDQIVHLLTRCIFDKKKFESGYINKLEILFKQVYLNKLEEKLNLVFFKFTPYLLEYLRKKNYSSIIKEYIQFDKY